MTKHVNEEYIRVAAYFLWENAGRPDGREQEFWQLACNQVFGSKPVCKKSNCHAHKAPAKLANAKAPVKKAVSKPVAKKVQAKPAVVAKPFYGIKK